MLWGVQWYFWLLLLGAIILLIFLWIKAMGASAKRRERMKREAAIWQRDYDLRENFNVLTEEKLKETENSQLLHGVAMNIQVMLEKEANMNEAFDSLPNEKKYIYALEYFDEDAKDKLSQFFRNNGEPLVPVLAPALEAIGANEYLKYVEKMMPMFDQESDVSFDSSLSDKLDEEFKEIYNSDELLNAAAKFIRNNKSIFIN